jgi:NAD-dependent dihydropyrimidine dehydrogenase PreA subunit
MKRQIITIDEDKCNGCGVCISACHEGAIELAGGKARLVRDDYCDGLGNCLPACPTGAITFEQREAAAFDEEAVKIKQAAVKTAFQSIQKAPAAKAEGAACGCPGTQARSFAKQTVTPASGDVSAENAVQESELRQWPVQIKLVPVNASYFNGANLLIAADCSAFAYASFHKDFIKNHITLIGCPKLDDGDYTEKLTAIIRENEIKSLTVVRMEVPCCGGLSHAATEALRASGKFIPWQVVTITTDGRRL